MSLDLRPLDWTKTVPDVEVDIDELEEDQYGFLQNGEPFTGIVVSHFPNGQLESRVPHLNGVPHGLCRWWHENGTMSQEWTSFRGMGHGWSTDWYETGQVSRKGYSEFGRPLEWVKFDRQGQQIETGSNRNDAYTLQWIERYRKDFPEVH